MTEKFSPLSGFRDVLGPTKSWVIGELQQIFMKYGYRALETPAIDRQEILLGKLGEEGQKQLYLFEDNGKRKVGLRYDLTVPLARFVAGNINTLALPFKRFEIGPVWRAEKPQKGRYRQFTQADVDIIGAPEPSSELELLSVASLACEQLKIKPVFQLNDRRVVSAILDRIGVAPSERIKLLQLLDKRDKLSDSEFDTQFRSLGFNDVVRRQVSAYFLSSDDDLLEQIKTFLKDDALTSTLEAMLSWAKKRGIDAEFTPAMVRGLDYYTGAIFELKAPEYDGGTIVAGGRYDDLVTNLTGQKLPSIGISFGVDRLADLLIDRAVVETIFVVRLSETSDDLNLWVRELRQQGRCVEVYLDAKVELGKQIKYADKSGYTTILIPFEEEWKKGKIIRKDLQTGKQEAIDRSEFENE